MKNKKIKLDDNFQTGKSNIQGDSQICTETVRDDSVTSRKKVYMDMGHETLPFQDTVLKF